MRGNPDVKFVVFIVTITIIIIIIIMANLLFNGQKTDYIAMFKFSHQLQLSCFDLNVYRSHKVREYFHGTHVSHALSTISNTPFIKHSANLENHYF